MESACVHLERPTSLHCKESFCWNYIRKCPMHSPEAPPAGMCTHLLRRPMQLSQQEVEDVLDTLSDIAEVYAEDDEVDREFVNRLMTLQKRMYAYLRGEPDATG